MKKLLALLLGLCLVVGCGLGAGHLRHLSGPASLGWPALAQLGHHGPGSAPVPGGPAGGPQGNSLLSWVGRGVISGIAGPAALFLPLGNDLLAGDAGPGNGDLLSGGKLPDDGEIAGVPEPPAGGALPGERGAADTPAGPGGEKALEPPGERTHHREERASGAHRQQTPPDTAGPEVTAPGEGAPAPSEAEPAAPSAAPQAPAPEGADPLPEAPAPGETVLAAFSAAPEATALSGGTSGAACLFLDGAAASAGRGLAEAVQPCPFPGEGNPYIRQLARDSIGAFLEPGLPDGQKVQAAYEYVIAHTSFAQPVGLDIWRVRGGGNQPSYLENRALSPLAFGLGSCEDYAAALCLLLEEMGFAAQYVPGITISVSGDFVDHAWCAVELEGQWYHLDPQLEDNIMKGDTLTYRYFLRSDAVMLADHRWGENLVEYGGLTSALIREVEKNYQLPACPVDWPRPAARELAQVPRPDRGAILDAVQAEKARYEEEHGGLPPLKLSVTPPVFGDAGYGPKDD